VCAEARLAYAPKQILECLVTQEIDALLGQIEMHLLGGGLGHTARSEHRLIPTRDLGRLGDVEVPFVDEPLHDPIEQLTQLTLDLAIAGWVTGSFPSQHLEHYG